MKLSWPLMIRRVQGHSMVPVLPPGTMIYGWRWFRQLKPQKVIVFSHDDKEAVKRIDKIEEESLFVLGDHPETSNDSRQYGNIPIAEVKSVVVWPRTAKVVAETLDQAKDSKQNQTSPDK